MKTNLEVATEMYEEVFHFAEASVQAGVEQPAMLFAKTKKGVRAAMVLEDTGLSKDDLADFHRGTAAAPFVEAAVLVLEAWAHMAPVKGEAAAQKVMDAVMRGDLSVRDLPEKNEIIVFNVRAGGEQFFAFCKIDRAAKSLERAALTVANDGDGNRVEGRFVGDGSTANPNRMKMN